MKGFARNPALHSSSMLGREALTPSQKGAVKYLASDKLKVMQKAYLISLGSNHIRREMVVRNCSDANWNSGFG
jgi:hypothetical protein